jgi:xanthine/uracil permease
MKILRIVSYVFMALGVFLFLVGLLFKIQHWPDIFNGVISGSVVTAIGCVFFIISLLKSNGNK